MEVRLWTRALFCAPALLFGSHPSASALSASDLQRQCQAFFESEADPTGQLCLAYVRGYLDATRLVTESRAEADAASASSFSQRAMRTRLGAQARHESRFCMPDDVRADTVIGQLLALAERSPPGDESAASLLDHTLRTFYRCKV
jgi:hypothetical protein